MGATTGIVKIGDYATPAGDPAKVNALLALIPNPDSTSSSGASAGPGNSYLDEMSPGCAAQLRVELTALAATVT
jgi:hypothetical protein